MGSASGPAPPPAATPPTGWRQLRQKARLLGQCQAPAEVLFLLVQIIADIEVLAAREEAVAQVKPDG